MSDRQSILVTRDEQKLITEFVERAVSGEQAAMDVEADAIIRALFVRNPDAAYRMTMLAMSLTGQLREETEVTMPVRKRWLANFMKREQERQLTS